MQYKGFLNSYLKGLLIFKPPKDPSAQTIWFKCHFSSTNLTGRRIPLQTSLFFNLPPPLFDSWLRRENHSTTQVNAELRFKQNLMTSWQFKKVSSRQMLTKCNKINHEIIKFYIFFTNVKFSSFTINLRLECCVVLWLSNLIRFKYAWRHNSRF
jgi:hypothetical protein